MNVMVFENDELNILIEVINKLQILYHPTYAPDGKFNLDVIIKLQNMNTMIFVDNNFLSPIYELVTTGSLRNEKQLLKVAAMVLFSKFLNARATCGLALFENDTAEKSTISAEEKRQAFIYAFDKIPPFIWKQLAFGVIDSIPETFRSDFFIEQDKANYKNNDELHYLMHRVSIMKIVHLLKDSELDGFKKFTTFFEWHADNLIIAESVLVYALLVYGNIDHAHAPKNYNSGDFCKVISGINNQAWDMFYLTHWSTYYYDEHDDNVYMFATDDITQKMIVVNNHPNGFVDIASTIFSSKNQKAKLIDLFNSKLGINRVNPLKDKTKEQKIEYIKNLYKITEEEFKLKYFSS